MARVSKLFPSFKDKKDSFVIRLIEPVSGKKLTGFKLNLADAIGNGVLIGFFLSILEAVLLLRFGLSHLGGIAANAVFTFSVSFSFVFLVALLLNLAGEWKESLTDQHKHYETFISFIFHLITLPLICLILWMYFSSHPFSRYDDKIRSQELISICEECTQKAVNSANSSNRHGAYTLN